MLALAATNGVGVVLFGVLYAAAGARWLSQPAFLVCLVLLFALVTALWMSVEDRYGRGRGALARLGRVVFGLLVVGLVLPTAALTPLFWLDNQLPAESGLNPVLAPVMTLILIALALTGLVNVVGGALAIARTLVGPRVRRAAAGRRSR